MKTMEKGIKTEQLTSVKIRQLSKNKPEKEINNEKDLKEFFSNRSD